MDDSMTCQRCHQPLLRDPSGSSLSQSQYNLLAGQLPSPPPPSSLRPAAKLASLPPASQPAAAAWAAANPGAIAESYVLLPELPSPQRIKSATTVSTSTSTSRPSTPNSRRGTVTEPAPPGSPAPTPTTPAPPGALAARLDSLLSSRTAIDHPLCVECTGLFQAHLQRELEELTRERDAYIAFERGLRKRGNAMEENTDDEGLVGGVNEWDALLTRRDDLEEEEKKLRAMLRDREEELDAVKEDEERVKAEEAAVSRDEEE
jgi:beclin 1